jgi:hypothetical protein
MMMASVCAHMEMVKEPPARFGDVADGGVESVLIGARWSVEAADLPNELKRGVMQLLIARGVTRGSQALDVPAHGIPTSRFCCLRRQLLPVMTRVDLIELQEVCQPQTPKERVLYGDFTGRRPFTGGARLGPL